MIQETNGFGQLKEIVNLLDDSTGIILIHVDTKDPLLYKYASEFVEKRKASGSVFLAKNRYRTIPGHVSILYTQLSGYFELLDLADWDYVINLSNFDWPLRHTAAIHKTLDEFPGYSYIDFYVDTGTLYIDFSLSSPTVI
jgi:Core-2/I-Branching enzyme